MKLIRCLCFSRLFLGSPLQAIFRWWLAICLSSGSFALYAQEFSYSVFGTLGFAISDRDFRYQRFIDSAGTFKRDSILGAQVDMKISSEWSATVQGKIGSALDSDQHWKGNIAWAFVSWRPNNEWLVRAGKVRIPVYLFSENIDVGQSYDFARMPTEMYSIAPTTDIGGLYITRTWVYQTSELNLDIYSGWTPNVSNRFYLRDTGLGFRSIHTAVTGSVLTLRHEDFTARIGFHHADPTFNKGNRAPTHVRYTHLYPGGPGYYVPDQYTDRVSNDLLTLGLDFSLNDHWRIIGEYERTIQHLTDIGANTAGGYLSVLRKINRFTPYVVISRLKTLGSQARLYEELDQSTIPINPMLPPALAQGLQQINTSQRILHDLIRYYDQYSLAIGSSYALTPASKIKFEWLHTWIGKGSSMVDTPVNQPSIANREINVFSLNYNFAF